MVQHGYDGGSKQKQSGMENWNILFDVSRYDSQLHVGMCLPTWLNNIQFQYRPTNVIHCGSTNQTFSNISDIKTHIFSNNTQWHLYIMCKDLHLTGWTIWTGQYWCWWLLSCSSLIRLCEVTVARSFWLTSCNLFGPIRVSSQIRFRLDVSSGPGAETYTCTAWLVSVMLHLVTLHFTLPRKRPDNRNRNSSD